MKYYTYILSLILSAAFLFQACSYLDVVPDETPDEKDAFQNPTMAERYLYSCYSFLPNPRHETASLDLMTADEVVTPWEHETFANFPKGNYNASEPVISYWNTLFGGIRRCYILLENIDAVPNMTEANLRIYKGEAKFLIAYYHFLLLKNYGPIPLIKGVMSIDMDKAWFASRYDRGDADYVNCAMEKDEYLAFVDALKSAEEAPVHGFEDQHVFEGCMPVEVMARRGVDTLRYGPLKPVGLKDPKTGREPYAVVQLRKDNAAGSVYNIVGFQTHLKFAEQKRVFSMIPALHDAEFVRYGVMHRNTFLDAPRVLSAQLCLKTHPNVFFAGQITGFEGYMESAASGLLAARNLYARLQGRELPPPPTTTMCGALIDYITTPNKDFQPMGANMGILPRTEEIDTIRDKRERYMALSDAAQSAMRAWAAEAEH